MMKTSLLIYVPLGLTTAMSYSYPNANMKILASLILITDKINAIRSEIKLGGNSNILRGERKPHMSHTLSHKGKIGLSAVKAAHQTVRLM